MNTALFHGMRRLAKKVNSVVATGIFHLTTLNTGSGKAYRNNFMITIEYKNRNNNKEQAIKYMTLPKYIIQDPEKHIYATTINTRTAVNMELFILDPDPEPTLKTRPSK
jgi:hypothetical protein